MFQNHFKTAWRSLRNNKGMSFLNIAGLSVGMTAAVLIFFWVSNETSFDTYHPDADRIYRLTTRTTDGNWRWEGSSGLLAGIVQKEVPGVEKTARLFADNWPAVTVNGELSYEKKCAYVDPSWFDLFSYHFTSGNAEGFAQDINGVVLTASTAKKYFGDREAIGETLRIDSVNYQVQGVVVDPPTNSSFQYHLFIQLASLFTNPQRRENEASWDNTDYATFIKVQPGVQTTAMNNRITLVLQKASHDDDHSIASSLVRLRDMHFENNLNGSKFEHGNIQVVYIFSILGFLLLLVACINYVNLTTAKASLRSKEVSIRKIVGAGRKHLFYQFLAESLLVSVFSLAATLLLIRLCLPAFNDITGKDFSLSIVSVAVWKVLGSTLLVAFLLNSIYPAVLLSSFKPLNIFRGITVLRVKDAYFRKGLVVLQFIISILLMTGTIVIYRQMDFIQKSNPGYDRSQVISVALPFFKHFDNKPQLMQAMKQELLASSTIQSVSMVNQPIVRISSATTGVDWQGHDTSFRPKVNQLSTDADLLRTMHLDMVSGRWFESGSQSDENNYILNETAVRVLNIPKPVLGQRFSLHGTPGRIIGVVKDFHFASLHDKTGPLVIFNNPGWYNFLLIRTTPQNAAGAVHAVEDAWRNFLPGTPLEYDFLDDQFNDLYQRDQQASLLIFVFAIIAVILSGMGLFGLAAFAAEQRTKEIGIRKVLGATLTHINALLSVDFIRLVGIAIVIASPLAWWMMNSWLQNFAYRISVSWWMVALSGLGALTVTLLITSYHSIQAGRRSPVQHLRTD